MKLNIPFYFAFFLLMNIISTNTMQSLYEDLGVANTASKEEITKAYRQLALKWHPDRNQASEARDIFEKITSAYETLTDQEKRAAYDRTLKVKKPTTQQPTKQQIETQKTLLNMHIAANREKDIHKKGEIAKKIVCILDTNNITDNDSTNKALTLLYEIAKQFFNNDQYDESAIFQQLGLQKSTKWSNQIQKKKFKLLKQKYEKEKVSKQKKEEFSKIKEEKRKEEQKIKEKINSFIAQSEATKHLTAFIHAKETTDKEAHINEAIKAIKNHRFIDPVIKETILKNILALTDTFYRKKDTEKQTEYARLGLAQSQQFGFERYEQQFEQFLPKRPEIQ